MHTTQPSTIRSLPRAVGLVAVGAALLGACGEDDPQATEPAVIEITGTDYGVAAVADTIVGGNSVISFTNAGEDIHHLQVWQVDDADSAAAAIRTGDLRVLADATAVGGVGAIGPGATHRVASDVPEGEYVVFCVIETPPGAHHELGMVAAMVVEGETDAEAPTADATLRITPDGFDYPDGWDGTTDLEIVNDHMFPADAEFLRLVDGATRDDVLGFIDGSVPGPPPFTVEGGVSAIGPGTRSVVLDDVRPGSYLLASFSPDPSADMAPQFLTGHLLEITIG
ncbi:MAG: hypothetical protein AAF081_10725 [Actinomycetota bacterium]